jgi:hypothetical protein
MSFFMYRTVYGRGVATVASRRLGIAADTGRLDKKIPDDIGGQKNAPTFRALEGRRGGGT